MLSAMNEITSINVENCLDSEICAAIAMALEAYNAENHDQESFVLTIKPTQSAWNSPRATLRQLPRKK